MENYLKQWESVHKTINKSMENHANQCKYDNVNNNCIKQWEVV